MGRFSYLNRLLGTKLLQVAYHLSLIDYLTLSNPSMNIKEFLPQTGRIQVIHISYQAFYHYFIDELFTQHTSYYIPFNYTTARSLETGLILAVSKLRTSGLPSMLSCCQNFADMEGT
jgi:hypothetical protein